MAAPLPSEVAPAVAEADVAAVRQLFLDYLDFVEDFLGESLGFQGTSVEFTTFPDIYDAIFLARLDGAPVGACGLKPFKDDICELKRLYVRPEGRGHGFGLRLTERCIEAAREAGYRTMYLDTNPGLTHANAVYEALGFGDIPSYYDNPLGDDSRYMALDLMR